MKKIILLFIIITACSNSTKENTDNIIPIPQFTNLIKDIHLIEAEYEISKFTDEKIANQILQNKYDSIFRYNKTDYQVFQQSLEHYSLNKNQLQLIYSNAMEELQREGLKLD